MARFRPPGPRFVETGIGTITTEWIAFSKNCTKPPRPKLRPDYDALKVSPPTGRMTAAAAAPSEPAINFL